MRHTFKSRLRCNDGVLTFDKLGEIVAIEYRPRLKCYDLIYHPDLHRLIGTGQFVRVIKYRTSDHLEILGLVVKALEDVKSVRDVENSLRQNILTMMCDPCA